MGLTDRLSDMAGRDSLTVIGLVLSALWAALLAVFWLLAPAGGGAQGLIALMGAALPVMLIWLAVGLARAILDLRAEAADLRLRLSEMRDLAATRGRPPEGRTPPAAASHRQPQPAVPKPSPAPAAPRSARPAPDIRQQAMRFDAPEPVRIAPDILIRALNFPDGPEDQATIDALRAALRDHDSARVLRAAQDVITLLAGHEVYMDDLPPDPAPAAVWRRFGEGARGSAVAAIGGIHDEMALEIAQALLRTDEIFRDAAHHFLRHFDVMLTRNLPQLDDPQIEALANARATRAFMLVGRAAHGFG